MTLRNNTAYLLYYVKLCASFRINQWIQIGVKVRVKIGDILPRVSLKFDGWPWKTIGHLFYTTSSFVHHFKAMGKFQLELQSGHETLNSGQNRQFLFTFTVTLQFDKMI